MRSPGRQGRRAAAGALIIAGLVAVCAVIFVLDDVVALTRRDATVLAMLPEGGDVVRGAPVWIAGREVGTVTRVGLLPVQAVPDTGKGPHVLLALRVPEEHRSQIRSDAWVRLTSARRIGEAAVDIVPGTPMLPPLAPGDTLRGSPHPGTDALLAEARRLRADLDSMLTEVTEVAPRTRTALGRYGALAARARTAGGALGELRNDLVGDPAWGALTEPAFDSTLASAGRRADEVRPVLEAFLARLDSVRAAARPATDRMAARADSLSRRLEALEAGLSAQGGILGRMATDSALVKALHGAQAQLDSLIAEAKANPLRFVF